MNNFAQETLQAIDLTGKAPAKVKKNYERLKSELSIEEQIQKIRGESTMKTLILVLCLSFTCLGFFAVAISLCGDLGISPVYAGVATTLLYASFIFREMRAAHKEPV